MVNPHETWGRKDTRVLLSRSFQAGENDTNINFVLDFVLRKALEIEVLLENSIYMLLVYHFQLNEIHCHYLTYSWQPLIT